MAYQARHRAILTLLLFLGGCVTSLSTDDAIVSSIKNKGPVRYDPQNPFLATSQFLKIESTKSQELAGFLNLKGDPGSIEIREEPFEARKLVLYYPRTSESYDLTKTADSWVITGPFHSQLANDPSVVAPAIDTPPPQKTFKVPPAPIPNNHKQEGAVVKNGAFVSPQPTTVPSTPTTAPLEPTKIPVITISPAARPAPALPSVQQEEPFAEISPRGDLVHYVTMSGETLSIIARWYTEDRGNAPKLSRLNRLKNSNALAAGDTIVIPSYMVKNKARLTEEGIRKMQAIADDEKSQKSSK